MQARTLNRKPTHSPTIKRGEGDEGGGETLVSVRIFGGQGSLKVRAHSGSGSTAGLHPQGSVGSGPAGIIVPWILPLMDSSPTLTHLIVVHAKGTLGTLNHRAEDAATLCLLH